jgi:hypothetical protein
MAAEFKCGHVSRSVTRVTFNRRPYSNIMDSDFDDRNGPIAGPSRIDTNPYQSSSLLQTPPAVSYPNLGDTGTKVKPQKLRRASNGIVDCDQ